MRWPKAKKGDKELKMRREERREDKKRREEKLARLENIECVFVCKIV